MRLAAVGEKRRRRRRVEGVSREEARPRKPHAGDVRSTKDWEPVSARRGPRTRWASGSGGRRKGLRGAQVDPRCLREQWDSLRVAGSERSYRAPTVSGWSAGGQPTAGAQVGRGQGRGARAAGARVVSPAVLQPPGAGRQGSASGSFRGGSRLPLAAAVRAGRGSAARKKM
jgi:hypothetical protein